jgi:hypothetical protein
MSAENTADDDADQWREVLSGPQSYVLALVRAQMRRDMAATDELFGQIAQAPWQWPLVVVVAIAELCESLAERYEGDTAAAVEWLNDRLQHGLDP